MDKKQSPSVVAPSEPTPGAWCWDVNPNSKYIRLEQARVMGDTVLMFERWGMQGATPMFRDEDGLMWRANEFAKPFPHRMHHADWAQFVDHPDARLIEQAEPVYALLTHILWRLSDDNHALVPLLGQEAVDRLRVHLESTINDANEVLAKINGTPKEATK